MGPGAMSRAWPASGSVLLRRVPRWLSPAALFIISFGLHHETLLGGFVWDDRPAVVGNQDVWAGSSWGDIWRHDFWGQQIAHAESHKSFRPLTTVTFKGRIAGGSGIALVHRSSGARRGAPSMHNRAAIVMKEKDSGPGVTRYCAALLFAASATLCKEVGITVFGLMAGGEVVRFFEEREWRQRKRKLWQRRRSGVISTARSRGIWRRQALREYWRCRFMMRVPAAAAARVVSATIFAVLLVYLHVRLHEGARVREWGVLENDISILPSRTERALSYAFTHAVYASKLLWPTHLCYDWGFSGCGAGTYVGKDPVGTGEGGNPFGAYLGLEAANHALLIQSFSSV
ncbi:conserved unknown protein [Ectocarpus siliculosus]|uniref:DUF1736 domain-containing protein n=1 Tax=Ectocarpus siliculosus TaxID=2880 RepID=D8LTI0_ECTSI|nr:conserved unknown protein [Ectocarpus siliculosus]|eukprot:CBN78021.1 conserved unknown protein [Ectocarpus siliculosus]